MGLFEKSFACVGIWLFMWAAGGVPSLMWVGRSLMWVGRGCRVRSCGPHFAHVGRAWVPRALMWSSLRSCGSGVGAACAHVVLTSAMYVALAHAHADLLWEACNAHTRAV